MDQKVEVCIFLGYSSVTKSYRAYNPLTRKVIVRKNVKLNEQSAWNCEKSVEELVKIITTDLINPLEQEENILKDENIDDETVRGVRPLVDIYQRSNLAILELTNYKETVKLLEWRNAM